MSEKAVTTKETSPPTAPTAGARLGEISLSGAGDQGNLPILVQENLARLEMSGEVGEHLIPTYLAALEADPRLEQALVVPYQPSDIKELAGTPGAAMATHRSPSGRPEVYINTGGWHVYEKFLRTREGAVAVIKRKLGMQPGEMDAKTFAEFTFGHETGHIREYIDLEHDPKAIDDIDREMDVLPIPGVSPSELITRARRHPLQVRKYFRGHRERLADLDINSVAELIAAQEAAYRGIPSEDAADQFAADVMKAVEKT